MATPTKTSPLAPAGGFPDLPVIEGVRFATGMAGVKYANRTDVMLAEIEPGASIAGVFTRSATRSAPVLDCQRKLGQVADPSKGFAILVNSGNSNAFTGARGVEAVQAITGQLAKKMSLPIDHVYTASTGVIGEPLPADRITGIFDTLSQSLAPDQIDSAARAIMTTDTYPKGACVSVELNGTKVQITGIAKGSGMIAPDMATMLVYIFTDARIGQTLLQQILTKLNSHSFNCITVDSDTSTSDSLMLVATGKADMPEIIDAGAPEAIAFSAALERVMLDLAHQVVKDGEGATKFVEVNVTGATSDDDARKVALSIANSPLVKTAIAGEDPNWGRVVMAVGKSGAQADRDLLTIRFGDILVAESGMVAARYTEDEGANYMKQPNITISVDLGLGAGSATIWTCDLTHGYVSINADYRS